MVGNPPELLCVQSASFTERWALRTQWHFLPWYLLCACLTMDTTLAWPSVELAAWQCLAYSEACTCHGGARAVWHKHSHP
jgi:hypothetical protein